MLADYVRDGSGSLGPTIFHDPSTFFNPAGIAFPVGRNTATTLQDPRVAFPSYAGGGSLSGSTITLSSTQNGTTPQVGMTVWDDPSKGHAYYSDQPKVTAVSGSAPNFTVTISKSETSHSGVFFLFSFAPGCQLFQGTATTDDHINCTFGNSSTGFTATFDAMDFYAIGGHNGTYISGGVTGASPRGNIIVTHSRLEPDQWNTTGNALLNANGSGVSLDLENSECDGGNSGDPTGGPWTYAVNNNCVNWSSVGSQPNHNNVKISNIYIHDWTYNPIRIDQGYVDVTLQSTVFYRNSMQCAIDGTKCHGANVQFGTTQLGSSSTVTMHNLTSVYPYGYQFGGITAPFPVLGGLGSAFNLTLDVQGITMISNISTTAGRAIASSGLDPFRLGQISKYTAQYIFSNDVGLGNCIGAGGDIDANGSGKGSESDNVTSPATSTWSTSGWVSGSEIYYPNQILVRNAGSTAPQFIATLADNGNGTSHLHINSTSITPTTDLTKGGTITPQIVALRMADRQAHPTLVISGSGADYTVSNGSGSGETQAAQTFREGQVIMPFGTGGTTAVGGTTYAGYVGTLQVGGNNQTVAVADNKWSNVGIGIGNVATLDTDISNNFDMLTSGDAGKWTVDGPGLDAGACPNHSAARLMPLTPLNRAVAVNDNVKDADRRKAA